MDEFRQLNQDDLKHLTNALILVKDKWQEIGLELKLEQEELNEILNDPRNHKEVHRLTAMLSLWLNRVMNPPQTWPVIVEALLSPMVKRADIAEKIQKDYCPLYPGLVESFSAFNRVVNECEHLNAVTNICVIYMRRRPCI